MDHGADPEFVVSVDGSESAEVQDIPRAVFEDFIKATQSVFIGEAEGSRIQLLVAE